MQSWGSCWHERCVVSKLIDSGEVPSGETVLYSGTDPESYITKYTVVYEFDHVHRGCGLQRTTRLLISEKKKKQTRGGVAT